MVKYFTIALFPIPHKNRDKVYVCTDTRGTNQTVVYDILTIFLLVMILLYKNNTILKIRSTLLLFLIYSDININI